MMWLNWLSPILLLLAGVVWVFPDSLATVTGYSIVTGVTVATVLGVVAIVVALWNLYEMTMKK